MEQVQCPRYDLEAQERSEAGLLIPLSQAFAPFATKLTGIDLSDNMVAQYNNTARDLNFSPTKMSAQQGDLLLDPIPEYLSGPEYYDFDVVAIGAALHHVESPGLVLKRLAARLRKGGVCLVMDHVSSHDQSHGQHQEVESFFEENPDVAATVKTHGFAREEMQRLYEEVGLGGGFEYVVVEEPLEFTMNGRKRQITIFLARGELI